MNTEHEFVSALAEEMTRGRASAAPDGPVVDAINRRFPMGFGRPNWSDVPGSRMLLWPRGESPLRERFDELLAFFDEFVAAASLSDDDMVTVVGDGVMDSAICLTVSALRQHLISLFQIPQHSYVVTPNIEWCFNFSFEEDAFFGRAVKP